jgi:hypothetical protein
MASDNGRRTAKPPSPGQVFTRPPPPAGRANISIEGVSASKRGQLLDEGRAVVILSGTLSLGEMVEQVNQFIARLCASKRLSLDIMEVL